jgi:hypothetical protein
MTGGNSGLAGALGVGIMLVSGVPTAAPGVDGGGKVGLGLAKLSSFSEPGGLARVDPDWCIGPTAGAFVHFRIADRIGFQPEVMFSMNVALEDGPDVDDRVKAADITMALGAGLQGRRWLVKARFSLGLCDSAEQELASDRAARRRAFAILAGLRF